METIPTQRVKEYHDFGGSAKVLGFLLTLACVILIVGFATSGFDLPTWVWPVLAGGNVAGVGLVQYGTIYPTLKTRGRAVALSVQQLWSITDALATGSDTLTLLYDAKRVRFDVFAFKVGQYDQPAAVWDCTLAAGRSRSVVILISEDDLKRLHERARAVRNLPAAPNV